MKTQSTVEKKVREIKRATRRKFSAEEKIRIVLEVFRAEESLAAICRREGIHPNLYYSWSKEFLEAGKKRLNGDIQRQATSTRCLIYEKKTVVSSTWLLNKPCPSGHIKKI